MNNHLQEESPFQEFQQDFQSTLPDSRARSNDQPEEEFKSTFFKSGGESLLSKMGGMILAKAFLPSGSHVKQALSYLDIAIKTELVLNELSSSLFWFSLLELASFVLCLLLFFTDPEEMVYIWFHFPHVARGVIGIMLMHKLPKSYQMAQNMSIPQEEKLPFEAIMRYILLAARDALKDFTEQTKSWLIAYFVSTVVCLFLDLTSFFIQVRWFASLQSAFADLTLIGLVCIFLMIDWFYILWMFSLQYKFPQYIAASFMKGLFGLMESLHEKLGAYLNRQKIQQERIYEQESKKYDYLNNDRHSMSQSQINYPANH